jgi:hypothetical protein
MTYWSTLRMKKNMKNTSIWYCKSFKTIDYMPREASASWMKQVSFLSHIIMKVGMSIDSRKIQDTLS